MVYNHVMVTLEVKKAQVSQPAFLDQPPEGWLAWLQGKGEKGMRARQVRRWIVSGRAESFAEMTDLPRDLRGALTAEFVPLATCISHHAESADGTHKLLLRLRDGNSVECVLIQEAGRHTACISTQ